MTKKFFFSVTVLCCFISGCTGNKNGNSAPNDNPGALATNPPTLVRTDLMTGLSNPWDLAFTNDGAVFWTEKCRGLSVQKSDQTVARLFGTTGSFLVANDLFCEGQSGMHGVALDPGFATNRFIYIFMASNLTANPRTNRVVRLTVNPTYTGVSNRVDIITDIPFKHSGNSWGGAGSHSGGRIRFGPDGFLYITTGDNHNGTLPQDLNKLGGKVLRVNRDGSAAPGNNTPAGGDPRIYTYGHRNVQGIAFQPGTGKAFIAEHGPNHSDEVTALSAGRNGGWDPKPEAGVSCADNYCGYTSNKPSGALTPMTDLEKFPQAMKPTWVASDSAGMGPNAFLVGTQWKSWNGALLVGIMASQELALIQLAADGSLAGVTKAALPKARMRSLVQGPDGNLYIATDEGAIWKVVPQ